MLLTKSSEPLWDRCENIQEHWRLQVGDEAHVVLGETFQEWVVRLAQFPILLQHRDTECQATEKQKACYSPGEIAIYNIGNGKLT